MFPGSTLGGVGAESVVSCQLEDVDRIEKMERWLAGRGGSTNNLAALHARRAGLTSAAHPLVLALELKAPVGAIASPVNGAINTTAGVNAIGA